MQAITEGLSPTLSPLDGYMAMALTLGLRPLGALAWRPESLSHEVAAAVSGQVSIAVARSIALETTARIEAAREGERLRTALIDSLTHELRTPLTSIRAAATTLLESEGLDEAGAARHGPHYRRRGVAARSADRRIGGDGGDRRERCAGKDVAAARAGIARAGCGGIAQDSCQAQGKHHSREWSSAPTRLHGSIRICWGACCGICWKTVAYTPPGSRATLSSKRTEDRLEFCVEDNGPGIDPRDLPLIFEKFYRGKRSVGARKGSGMGLAITRAILTAHGGGIEATNVPGVGARFRFWVPLIEKEPSRQR